jgi:hypothetical protein
MSLKEILKTTTIIFYSLLAGQLILLITSVYFVSSGIILTNIELLPVLIITVLLLTPPMLVIGPIIYRKMISNQLTKQQSIEQKMILYRRGLIIKLALIEGLSLFSIISFLITGNYIFITIFILLIGLSLMHKPSFEKFVSDFKLSSLEIDFLKK